MSSDGDNVEASVTRTDRVIVTTHSSRRLLVVVMVIKVGAVVAAEVVEAVVVATEVHSRLATRISWHAGSGT